MKFVSSPDNRDIISLFSGAMGLDLGLISAGLSLRVGQDFDSACIATMRANNHRVVPGDIRSITPETMLEVSGLVAGEPFLVCGGPPCQPFSTAGKRGGIADPRGSLFMDFVRMLDGIRPRFFVMENVKGLMSAKAGDEFVLSIILEEFKRLGYKTVYGLLDAVNYGVPQFRERFVLIGSRDHEDIFLPVPTHFQTHQNAAHRWATLRQTIADLENNPGEHSSFSTERLDYLRLVPPGGNWRSLPADVVEKAMGGAFTSGGGKVGFYRRLDYDQPAPTLVTSPVQKATMLCHPVGDRPLSVAEYSRIQQFPDDWIITGDISNKYRQIGNAVPIGLARAIGEVLISVADGTATVKTKRTRGTDLHNRIKQAMERG